MDALVPPKDAADRLGVSASGLRRLATLYEGLYGPLPRDSADSRLWPEEALERLSAARGLVAQGRARSIQDALQAVVEGGDTLAEGLAPRLPTRDETLNALVEEMRAMRAEISELRGQVRALEASKDDPTAPQLQEVLELNRALVGQIMGPEEPNEMTELRRMNEYLLGELERRRLEAEHKAPSRPWWRFWRRS